MVSKRSRILSKQDVTDLICDGNAIVIYEQSVLDLTSWIDKHPGGDKAVFHMVGRDATDEMQAYHSPESLRTFKYWKIGNLAGPWDNLLPPIQGGVYRKAKEQHLVSRSRSLEDSLDFCPTSSGSEKGDISSSNTSEDEASHNSSKVIHRGIGYPNGPVESLVPQGTPANEDLVSAVFAEKNAIFDPRPGYIQYDNAQTLNIMNKIPNLDYDTQNDLREKYAALHDSLTSRGFYNCDYWDYYRELIKIGSIFLISISFLKTGFLLLSAITMGITWQQMTFIAHDAGHVAITHNYQVDNTIGMIVANWCGGLSLGWWKRNHNVHHLVTNDPAHDPDIQHLPFFAVSTRLFGSIYSTYYERILPIDKLAQLMLPLQNYTFYPILCFGRFNLYRLSWEHLIRGLGPKKGKAAWFRYFELAGLTFFAYWFFYLLVARNISGGWNRFNYIMVSHITTMLVHVQITLSHFAMSTCDLGVSELFVSRQVRTTMDVDCPQWLDFLHGGLQFQTIHHLFPRMPRHNLRKAQADVIDFCNECGLKYSIYGFGKGNQVVISHLGEIAKQFDIMVEATKGFDGNIH